MFKKSFYFLFFGVLLLSGCGGGGASSDSTPTTPNIIPILSVPSNLTITKNKVANNASIIENRGSAITSCTVSPDLPTGLTLNSDCTLSGTVSSEVNATLYTFTATNASGTNSVSTTINVASAINANISGTITYDSVPTTSYGLNYNAITQKPIRAAELEVVDVLGNVLNTLETDNTGAYSVSVNGTMIKIRVSAKLYKAPVAGQSSWNFQVKDNTNGDALYAIDGNFASLPAGGGLSYSLNAPSGWGGSSYTSTRSAAAFAILDVVYEGLQKVKNAQADALFPPLNIFWSVNNIESDIKQPSIGHILTSHYDGSNLYILGKENVDTDEYDSVIVAHEWGHYYEDKFSRSDNIGNPHRSGDSLDIRLAFGEGFGTAFGCMILDSTLYIDTFYTQQKFANVTDVEDSASAKNNPGWYSEASIIRILYDIYDSTDDTGDTLSLGFSPIHDVLTNGEKNTTAFTSIFTFIKALKDAYPGNDTKIDAITSNESIEPITDIYGTGRNNRTENANPLYANLSVGNSVSITTNYAPDPLRDLNKLGRYNFVKFTIVTAGSYTITANSQSGTNLVFAAYQGASRNISISSGGTGSSVSGTANLNAGEYRMWVTDKNVKSGTTISVSLVKN